MSDSIEKELKRKFYTVITIIFFSFSLLLLWSYRYSYYTSLEKSLEHVAESVEQEIESSHYNIKKSLILNTRFMPFSVHVYKYEQNRYVPIQTVSKRVERSYTDGFHIEQIDKENDLKYEAHYGKHFDVYHHRYYIHVAAEVDHYLLDNYFLSAILFFLLLSYLLLLHIGNSVIQSMIRPLHTIIDDISKIEDTTCNTRLPDTYHNDEYRKLANVVNRILEKLNASLMKTKHFNAKVSHELRTPLTIIRGEIEVALMKERKIDDYRLLLKSTLEEVDTLQSITDNMLLLTKLDFQAMHVKRLQIRVDKMIREVISSSLIHAESKSIDIISDLESITFPMEEILIKQSIKNLINNAIKYSPSNTTIHVNLYREGQYMIIEVNDEGFGISEEDIENLFNPYFRSSNIQLEEISGEGLGLAIVYHTLQLHHAEVKVISKMEQGTQFKLLFKYEK